MRQSEMTILLHLYNWTRLVWFVYRQKWIKVEPFFKPFLTMFTFELTHNIVAHIFQVIQIEQYPLLARELSSIGLACSGEATSQPQTELCCLSQTEDNNNCTCVFSMPGFASHWMKTLWEDRTMFVTTFGARFSLTVHFTQRSEH